LSLDPRQYATDAILRNGASVLIRAIRPEDKKLLVDLFERMSEQSRYFRFFGVKKRLTPKELEFFSEPDFVDHVGLVAALGHNARERVIGVGRYIADPQGDGVPRRAEVALAVEDAHQGQGVGTLLLEHLASMAHDHGISEFVADVLGENNRMMGVFKRSGFKVKRALEGGIFHISLPTVATERFIAAHEERERQAAEQSIRPILNPGSVAIVGASPKKESIGTAILENLQKGGFTGALYPVHPTATEIGGLRAFPKVSAIGQPVDLAVIAIPASGVRGVLEDCAEAGVRGIVLISSGFAESSGKGRAEEQELSRLVRSSGMRMVGPNCMGVLNTDPEILLNATFAPHWPPAGNIGMLSQSGALGIAILDKVKTLDIGLSTFVSVGNKADVSGNDLLAYWAGDPRTEVILLYLESFGNPRKFGRLAPIVGRQKPIVAVKSGRSLSGRRAAQSHSAALASLDVAVDALFEQVGVIRTNTLEELFDVASFLSSQPVPSGPRVGVITNAGGPAILLADACEALGLVLPELSPATGKRLASYLPPQAGLSNPVDMIASATSLQYERTVEAVGNDPSIDSVVVIHVPTAVSTPEEIARGIARGAAKTPREKPIVNVFISSEPAPAELQQGPRGRLPHYDFPENAARALAAAQRYGRWKRRPKGTSLTLPPFARSAVRAVLDRVLSEADGPVWLEPTDLASVLGAAEIDFAVAERTSIADAPGMAERMGYPLVAKAIAQDVVHKSDVGGVILGLESPEEVAAAVRTIEERMRGIGARLDGILLQREVRGGVEAFIGVTTDPTFGPLVLCGLGGVLVELLRDISYRLPPVSDVDAAEMLDKLRTSRLLDGFRGTPRADREALIKVIQRVSALVEEIPELLELDLNPVKVLAPGKGATAVDGRMRVAPLGWNREAV
jgi:acetyl coenzyme A synthetase (ADP forming)-like protein